MYNAAGLRVKKIADGVPTEYFLHGKLITHMTRGDYSMHFFYDGQSRLQQVEFTDNTKDDNKTNIYTYVHNLQGDIVGIVDADGNKIVEYKYDAWGKLLSCYCVRELMLGFMNPFRYRGYVYDEETGLYYLRSRYYNPIIGRFVNADAHIGDQGITFSHNVFAYCINSPLSRVDQSGKFSQGLELLNHWIAGSGDLLVCNSDEWGEYMRNCTETHPVVLSLLEGALSEAMRAAYESENGVGFATIKEQRFTIELDSNGYFPNGYAYLHGTDSFYVSGQLEYHSDPVGVEFELTCRWDDRINPNYNFWGDRPMEFLGRTISLGNAQNYDVSVLWTLNQANFLAQFDAYLREKERQAKMPTQSKGR